MNAYDTLKLELDNFYSLIQTYTSDTSIDNLLSKLKDALYSNDTEKVQYCLEGICEWYDDHIQSIVSNKFCMHPDAHQRNLKLLHKIKDELSATNYQDVTAAHHEHTSSPSTEAEVCKPKIFLSHRSVDSAYGDCIERLLVGIGVSNEQLIYSSHPLHKIPLNQNIYDYLRSNLQQHIFMIILWSNDYLESPACLNEMGAIWVMQSDYTNVYTPDFEFGNPKYHECAVDTRKMGAVLKGDKHCKANMRELIDTICHYLSLAPDEQTIMHYLDTFMEEIKNIAS